MNKMEHAKNISETAFLTATCRSKNTSLSKDIFAKFFVDDKSKQFTEKYLEMVSSKEVLLQGLRNRFFLDQLKDFFKKYPGSVFVNLGAGFSTYPFLLPEKAKFIEIDESLVVDIKKEKIKELANIKLIPGRKIDFYSVNFNNNVGLEELEKYLTKKLRSKKSFILIEGLIYYLNKDKAIKLLKIIQRLQSKNSIIGILILSDKFIESPINKRFKTFIKENIGNKYSKLTFVKPDTLKKVLKEYTPIVETNYSKLSYYFRTDKIELEEDIFWEDFFIFKKK